ncbi:TonB-dependent receptor [Phenylobacterium sp. J426]|uniref:TonB-dependent receptor n=1 Tax=Phenylobacterium sp. J426 TaxID=2898439 RepID=UPI0021509D57|nr:TonB-dependent receptor [Phenylobacterium sp. J426]MCR5876178.1 TonB-dependent receptor [Phenylobacterium sp. J426]
MRMHAKRSVLAASAAVAALTATGGAWAADAPAAVEELVVTAQKREQALIEVPQSISVVSGSDLENLQATTFSDYLKLVPGLQVVQANPGNARLVIRGVNTGGVASTVGVYVDETPFGSSTGLANGAILAGDFDTFDVARVEVLRGPQGTFYGANSLGGVLKFVTNEPRLGEQLMRARANLETTKGGGESYGAAAVINVPFGDTLAFRASGSYRDTAGFIDSIGTAGSDVEKDIDDGRSYGGRASLLFAPLDTLSVRLSMIAQNIETDAPTIAEADATTLEPLYDRLSQSQFVPQFSDVNYRVYNATVNADLGFADLTSSTSYSTQKQTLRDDLTFNLSGLIQAIFGVPNEFLLAQNTNLKKLTQEVRLSSKAEGPIEWLAGAYYNKEDGLIRQEFRAVQPGTLTDIAGLPVLGAVQLPSNYEEVAVFGNVTAHLGDRLDVDVGGRWSRNEQSAAQTGDGVLAGGPQSFSSKSSEEVFTYSIAPRFELSENASVYARVAKGFRPGGPNVVPPNAPPTVPRSYDSDSVMSYEVGLKAESADRRWSLDVAAFHIDWKDIQLFASVNGFGVNVNGGKAKSQGAEFNAAFRPMEGLSLSVNGAYTNAKLKDDTDPLVGGLDGDRLPFTPKLTLGLNADYRWALNGATDAFVGGSVRHVSDQSGAYDAAFRGANGRQREIDAYQVVDLRAGVDLDRFTIEAYAKNVFDSDGLVSTAAPIANGLPVYPNGAMGVGVIRPRTVGVAVTAEF